MYTCRWRVEYASFSVAVQEALTAVREAAVFHCELRAPPPTTGALGAAVAATAIVHRDLRPQGAAAAAARPGAGAGGGGGGGAKGDPLPPEYRDWPFLHGRTFFDNIKR